MGVFQSRPSYQTRGPGPLNDVFFYLLEYFSIFIFLLEYFSMLKNTLHPPPI